MRDNILVIGNGYDIAHGLNTRYTDFIKYINKAAEDDSFIENSSEREFIHRCIENNGFLNYFLNYANEVPGWVDLERLIKEVVGYFEAFFTNYIHFIDNGQCISWSSYNTDMTQNAKMRVINCLYGFQPLFDRNNSHAGYYSKHLSSRYYTEVFGLNKREILKLLKKQLDEIIKLLQIYLKNHMTEKSGSIRKKSQIEAINPSYVISFNYTNTYKIYGINPEDVFHVHGSLDTENMVLGFNDDDEENLDFVYFKKYFQRIQKLTGYMKRRKLVKIDSMEGEVYPIIHFYGHSMDKTDEDVIKQLRTMSAGFVIYKYNQEDYEQKVINLIDVFGKKDATEMIQDGFIKFVQCS